MSDMSSYEINEEDIESVVKYLKIHDPENADRDYAIQLLEAMQQTAKELVDQDLTFAQLLEETLKKKD